MLARVTQIAAPVVRNTTPAVVQAVKNFSTSASPQAANSGAQTAAVISSAAALLGIVSLSAVETHGAKGLNSSVHLTN